MLPEAESAVVEAKEVVRRLLAASKVRFALSVKRPPVVMNGMRVAVRLVAVRDGVESAPVEEIVVEPVCPAAKVLAVSAEEKRLVVDAELNESVEGSESVTVPSPSSVTVI